MVSRFNQGRKENINAHNLQVGVDQIACKIIGLVLSTVLGANADGSFISLRGYFLNMSVRGPSALKGESNTERPQYPHGGLRVNSTCALLSAGDFRLYLLGSSERNLYIRSPFPYLSTVTSLLNTSRPGAPSSDLLQSSLPFHLPPCARSLCRQLRGHARERWALVRARRRRVDGRSTRASSGLGILSAWLGR